VNKPTIIYDSHCTFCTASIDWVAKRDPHQFFAFEPSDSDQTSIWLKERGIDAQLTDKTIILIKPGEGWFIRAEAIGEICAHLSPKPWWFFLFTVFPNSVLDIGYKLVSYFRRWSN
jgi:predicted DCC family thiol-disulfide oxidoreductase YuxK